MQLSDDLPAVGGVAAAIATVIGAFYKFITFVTSTKTQLASLEF